MGRQRRQTVWVRDRRERLNNRKETQGQGGTQAVAPHHGAVSLYCRMWNLTSGGRIRTRDLHGLIRSAIASSDKHYPFWSAHQEVMALFYWQVTFAPPIPPAGSHRIILERTRAGRKTIISSTLPVFFSEAYSEND